MCLYRETCISFFMHMHYKSLEEYTENPEVTCLSGKGTKAHGERVGGRLFTVYNFGPFFF